MFKKNIFSICCILGHLCISTLCHGFEGNNTSDNQEILFIIQKLNQQQHIPIANKLELVSNYWLNRPYKLYCLGEGPTSIFDQRPLYRTDGFDCETFVDMTLAIAYSDNFNHFLQHIKHIRYENGVVDFEHRNHFTNIDWNKNNRAQHYIKDITLNIKYKNTPIAIKNRTEINKKMWYKMMSPERIYLINQNTIIQHKRLKELRHKAKHQHVLQSDLYYIPLEKLFTADEKPIPEIFQQIPHGAIIQIITPQSHTKDKIGTELDISHLGFAFYKNQKLYFRHASFTHKKVEDVLLTKYLKDLLHHKIIRGIHLEMPQENN